MEAALRARLLADGGIAAIVQVIAWVTRPQASALPAITLQKVTADRGYTMTGPSGFHGEIVQFDVWANSFAENMAIRTALLAEMESAATASGVVFSPSFLNSERQTIEEVAGGSVHRLSLDFVVWWHS